MSPGERLASRDREALRLAIREALGRCGYKREHAEKWADALARVYIACVHGVTYGSFLFGPGRVGPGRVDQKLLRLIESNLGQLVDEELEEVLQKELQRRRKDQPPKDGP